MDTILDGGSPRRGSLNSLHRQSSGSFSNTSRPVVSSQANSSTTNNNSNNLTILHKDLDKFTRYFIIKTVQVIVQSRIGEGKRIKTDCKPNGNDWFNINITDIAEVSERTKAALDSDGLSIKSNWRVCCEISLKTNDGGAVVLEHWIITNKSNLNPSQNHLSSKLNNPTKSHQSCSRMGHLSTSNNSSGPLSAVNSTTRASPFSNKMRSRLNSINDCPGDSFAVNKLLAGANNENFDIKSSTSCFSLATSLTNHPVDNNATATITPSPSATSLSNNQMQAHLNSTTNSSSSHQTNSKTSAMSSIYTIYNRMSLLLKTLMTTTHIVPAYRLASRSLQTDSCMICYRVYTGPSTYQKLTNPISARGSIEDVSYNFNPESPNRRSSSSNSSFGSINIKDFVSPDELDHFCPILKLGSVKTDINELEVSLCYRTDVKNSNHLMRSPRSRDNMYNKMMDEECITAAKTLLAGNENLNRCHYRGNSDSTANGTNNSRDKCKNEALNYIDQPLMPAFAAKDPKTTTDKESQDPNLVIVESAFDGLLQFNRSENGDDDLLNLTAISVNRPQKMINQEPNQQPRSTNSQSEPIQVPTSSERSKHVEIGPNLSTGSTPKSLTDSFVFVDLNPPFASEEQNDLNSFFHGPSPAFSNGFDSLKDVEELTNQLADIEANASQLDEFVDNICVSEDEEDQ